MKCVAASFGSNLPAAPSTRRPKAVWGPDRPIGRALLLAAAILLGFSDLVLAQGPHADSVVQRTLKEGGELPVIIRYRTDEGFNRAGQSMSGKFETRRWFKGLRTVSARVNARAIEALLSNRDVLGVSYDAPVTGNLLGLLPTPPPSVSIDASGSKVARSRYDVTGSGVTVAIIDSGVKPHADLPASRIKAFVDFVNGGTTAYDDYGHGTHVAGIIAGSGASSSGKYTGAAPDASIVALKVLDHAGAGSTANVLAALDWVLTNHAAYGIRVVNLSLGHPIYEPAATDPMVQLVEALTQQGLVVVVSAGNLGKNSLGQTVYGSITSPANAQGAITVGAVDTAQTVVRSDDKIASFSSRGPTKFDYFMKPDVLAPGYQVASLMAPDSTLATRYPNLQIGSSYFRLNGTSMAAPVVAGEAALLLQANPALTSHTVKAIVQFTSQRLRDLDVMTQGAGEVNVAGAVRFAKMVHADQEYGRRWVRGSRKPIAADLLFGETAYWGRALVWGSTLKASTDALYLRLAQWDDNIVWGMLDDNIVWGMLDDNIVWGMLDDNIVWGMDDTLVWGLTDDNMVWGFDDAMGGLLDDNIVWGMDDNIVWGGAIDSVAAFCEEILGQSYGDVVYSETFEEDNMIWGYSVLIDGEVR